jgi:leucyl-tRNA synthetase
MKTNMHVSASPRLFGFARKMRNNPTAAEAILWSRLRGKQTGFKFRRQHPFSNYVVDFYCYALKYVIEVDGDIHEESLHQMEDEQRDFDLEAKGILVQRFSNEEVLHDIETVMLQIHNTLAMLKKKYQNIDADSFPKPYFLPPLGG